MSKDIGYYPKGPLNQHKALATGGSLESTDTRNLDPSGWGPGGMGKGGRIVKSGTSTGSGATSKGPKTTPP